MGRQKALIVALALAARVARAGGDDEARELYKQAVTHYDLAEYDQAIEKFKAAYELSHEPRLLFDIAQAYRLKGPGSCRKAQQLYRTYLRLKPTAENKPAVENWLAELESCAQAEPPDATPIAAPPPPAPAPAPPPRTPVPPAPSHWLQWSLVAGGGGLAIAGGATLLWVRSDFDAAKTSCRPDCSQTRSTLSLRADVGYVLTGVGAALVAAGVVVWLRGDEYVAPAPGGVVVGGRF